jgi:hypothetical protein
MMTPAMGLLIGCRTSAPFDLSERAALNNVTALMPSIACASFLLTASRPDPGFRELADLFARPGGLAWPPVATS